MELMLTLIAVSGGGVLIDWSIQCCFVGCYSV